MRFGNNHFMTIGSQPLCAKPEIAQPEVKPKPDVDSEVLSSVDPHILEDSFVYVHCHYKNAYKDMLIRIWRSTFLVDKGSSSRSKLVHAENISFAPMWTQIPDSKTYSFLLIFTSLPKSCQEFDLLEDIPQPCGFFIGNISRNQTDVYHLDLE